MTRAQLQRHNRQEALREQLIAQGHHQHIVDLLDKLGNPAVEIPVDMVARYKIVLDAKQKLVNKYLPELKAAELTGEGGGPVEAKASVEWTVIDPRV